MDDPMKRRYICTDTTTGILSAIYDAWKYDRSDQEAGDRILGEHAAGDVLRVLRGERE